MLQLSHKNLEVYRLSMKLLVEVYQLTKNFPTTEQYGLTSQLRRAVVSVCSNIAEGAARISKVEKKRFYEIARSSIVEMDTQFEAALLLGYIKSIEIAMLENLLLSVFKILSKIISNLSPTSY